MLRKRAYLHEGKMHELQGNTSIKEYRQSYFHVLVQTVEP